MNAIIDIQNHLPMHRVEYHRHGAALLPDLSDPDPGMAILVMAERTGVVSLSCNCRAFKKKKNCSHIGEVSGLVDLFKDDPDQFCFDGAFRAGPWYRLAAALNEACHVDSSRLAFRSETAGNGHPPVLYILRDEAPVVAYYPLYRTDNTPGVDEQELLVQRLGLVPPDGHPFHRGRAIDMLASMTLTESESVMQAKNLKSRRQVLEKVSGTGWRITAKIFSARTPLNWKPGSKMTEPVWSAAGVGNTRFLRFMCRAIRWSVSSKPWAVITRPGARPVCCRNP